MTMTVGQGTFTGTGLDAETLEMTIQAINEFLADSLPPDKQLELDQVPVPRKLDVPVLT